MARLTPQETFQRKDVHGAQCEFSSSELKTTTVTVNLVRHVKKAVELFVLKCELFPP